MSLKFFSPDNIHNGNYWVFVLVLSWFLPSSFGLEVWSSCFQNGSRVVKLDSLVPSKQAVSLIWDL